MNNKTLAIALLASVMTLGPSAHDAWAKPTVGKVAAQIKQLEALKRKIAKDGNSLTIDQRAQVAKKVRSFTDLNNNGIPDVLEPSGCAAGVEVEAKGLVGAPVTNQDGTVQFTITVTQESESEGGNQSAPTTLTFVTTAQTIYRGTITGPTGLTADACVEAKGYSSTPPDATTPIPLFAVKSDNDCNASGGGGGNEGEHGGGGHH